MDIFAFDPASLMSFLLTLIRVSLIVFLLPFFGGENIPIQVKAAICLVITLAIWPHLAVPGRFFPAHPLNIGLLVLNEVILGLLLGFSVQVVFAGLQSGGTVIGFQMGFSMITLADPNTGEQLIVTSFLCQSVAMALFLSLNGHLYILSALMSSFQIIQPGQLLIDGLALGDIIRLSGQVFVLALKIAGPIIGCLFMVDLALALVAKVAPQMNLLMIGFPIKIAVGLILMSIIFSLMSMFLDDFLRGVGPMFENIMRSVRAPG
jgi:flagellar biosynthetic protein FliR